jgi:small subunit ribosomal protein S2
MSRTNFDQLLQAGCHFGHLHRKWNPAMAPYIFMERNGIHIIDLNKTVAKIDEAAEALKAIAKSGKKILFVATKKQAKEIVSEKATSVNMPYVTERWAGGTFSHLSKRELLQISRQREKLEKNLGSISDLSRLPAALFVIDVMKEKIAVNEANRLGIPVFGMVDTNSDPRNIDYVIPANDDASDSIEVVLNACCGAIAEGLEERKVEKADEKASAEQNEEVDDVRPRRAARRARREEKPQTEEKPAVEAEAVKSDEAKSEAEPVKKEEPKKAAKPAEAKKTVKAEKPKAEAKPAKEEPKAEESSSKEEAAPAAE